MEEEKKKISLYISRAEYFWKSGFDRQPMNRKGILFLFSHPAQFLFARKIIENLKESGVTVHILIKKKDVLEQLLQSSGFNYVNIQPESRKPGVLGILQSLVGRNREIYKFVKRNPVDLMVGTDASVAQVGRLLGIQTVTILEDDYAIIKELALLTYPFTSHIVVPEVCDVGPFKKKKVGYPGYMKLSYLAPGIFEPQQEKVSHLKRPYCLLRLSALQAHHDSGIRGLSEPLLKAMIEKLEKSFHVYISSEKELKEEFKQYHLDVNPADIHHVLTHSELFISDSQSMTVEAALLGVPSIRYSDFVGKISVLNELEEYKLTYGVIPGQDNRLWEILDDLIEMEDRGEIFKSRRATMLSDKIDVAAFFSWFLSEYPGSADRMKADPGYAERFRFDGGAGAL